MARMSAHNETDFNNPYDNYQENQYQEKNYTDISNDAHFQDYTSQEYNEEDYSYSDVDNSTYNSINHNEYVHDDDDDDLFEDIHNTHEENTNNPNIQYSENNQHPKNNQHSENNNYSENNLYAKTHTKNQEIKGKLANIFNLKNEKFIILALLASVLVTLIIIGLGWYVLSPSKKTSQIAPINLANKNTLTQESLIGDDELIIMYNSQDNEVNNTSNTKEILASTPNNTNNSLQNTISPDNTVQSTNNNSAVQKVISGSFSTPTSSNNNTTSYNNIKDNVAQTTVARDVVPISSKNIHITSNNSTSSQAVKSIAKTSTQYWIQIFSTTNKDKAEQIKQELSSQGIIPTIVAKSQNQQIYYRLRIGPYDNKLEAQKFLSWFSIHNSYKEAYISLVYLKN